jgi:hypothetical protein
MRKIVRVASVVLLALVMGACATTMRVSSQVARGVDFARYHTYDWGSADDLPTGDPRLDRNPFFQDHLQGAVERQLAAQGFERTASGTPDLLVHYHASLDRRLDVHDVHRRYGHCLGDECQAEITTYEAGTLVLDIVDTHTNDVIWRGWAQDSVEGVLDNQDKMARQINEAVQRMLAKLDRDRTAAE